MWAANRQDQRAAIQFFPGCSVPISVAFQRNLPAKHAVDDEEVSEGEAHAERPPDEPDVKSVWSRKSLLDRDVVLRAGGGWQQARIESDGCSDQHHCEIQTGAGERFVVVLFA